ncbi:MAG: hypothetical protein II891_06745 [Bacteroidales bacterium]|nr:hypothetical protein [Bacteroidales bacterium]
MRTIRTIVKAKDFKAVEINDGIITIRWDAVPEVITIPAKKEGEEGKTKQTDNVICTELVFRGRFDEEDLRDSVAKDLAVRYPEGGAPEVDAKALIKEVRKAISE